MFKSKLAKIAAKTLANGTYNSIDDIISRYPNGVKVNGITVKAAKNTNSAYAFNFLATDATDATDTRPYFFAESGDLKKLVDAWLDEMTLDEIDTALAENPITLRLYKITTRNNRPYVKAHIIDDTNDTDDTDADNGDSLSSDDLEKTLAKIKNLIAEKEIERDNFNNNGNSAVAARVQNEIDALNQKKEKLESLLYNAGGTDA